MIPKILKQYKTFCILPWIHIATRPNGALRCCCVSAGGDKKIKQGPANLNTSDLLTAWNNEYMKNVRQTMLRGEVPPDCERCFREEKVGLKSKRIWETTLWSQELDVEKIIKNTSEDGTVPPVISYVDLRMNNKCNLKCIMCSPLNSSEWISDCSKLYPKIDGKCSDRGMKWREGYDWHKNNKIFWKQFYDQVPNLRQIYFAGGEPLIIEEHFDLLRECIKQGYAKNMELRYNSNGLNLPEELFELWKNFKKIKFGFSLDSIDEMNYYIRYPSNWENIVKNLRRLDETPDNVEVTISCLVQVLNIFYIPDFIKWKLSMNFKKINPDPARRGVINLQFLHDPSYLNVKILPLCFKDEIKDKFEDFYKWLKNQHKEDTEFTNHSYGIKRLRSMLDFVYSEDWSNLMPEFREYIHKMDKIRGTDFKKVFPEIKKLII